jgi:hypothetical protein
LQQGAAPVHLLHHRGVLEARPLQHTFQNGQWYAHLRSVVT